MCNKIVPVALLIIGMLVSGGGRAQVYSCRFEYKERSITDYSSLLSGGNVKQKRNERLSHAGAMHITVLNDSVMQVRIITDSFSTTMTGVTMPLKLRFNAYIDKLKRVYKVSAAGDNRVFLSVLQVWLGEFHMKCPPAGPATETKPDGDLTVDYIQSAGNNAIAVKKENAAYLIKPGSKQVVLLNAYKWNGVFNKQTKWPQQIQFYEEKKQVMGRKVLACIQRQLVINSIPGTVSPPGDTNDYQTVYLYPRLTESERRERLAVSLVGKENLSTISNKLQQAETLTNEQQFRLKSIIRSLFILDSTAVVHLLQLPAAKEENTAAFDIIENALIESRTNAGDRYIAWQLRKNERNYERLKELLIKISLAETLTNGTARQLLRMLQAETDPDTRSMISLALSNYALSVRQEPAYYNEIINQVLQPFKNGITDTLQYIYLTGNAGILSETDRLIQIAHHSRYRDEAFFALRNNNVAAADVAIQSYLLNYRGNEDVFAALLAKREVPASFWKQLEKNIITADARKDSTALPAIRFVLDNAWQRNINVKELLTHRFQMEAYRQEIADFKKQASLCK